jgi:hypothetical protein
MGRGPPARAARHGHHAADQVKQFTKSALWALFFFAHRYALMTERLRTASDVIVRVSSKNICSRAVKQVIFMYDYEPRANVLDATQKRGRRARPYWVPIDYRIHYRVDASIRPPQSSKE